jgi:hypothetical protein
MLGIVGQVFGGDDSKTSFSTRGWGNAPRYRGARPLFFEYPVVKNAETGTVLWQRDNGQAG